MPQRPKRRMRCCYCQSLQTRKNGKRAISPVSFDRRSVRKIQRYECLSCGGYFCKRREKGKKYTFGFKVEVTRMHVEERLSYRVMAKRVRERFGKRISPKLLCQMVNEVAERSKSSVEIQREYRPQWSGYLTVDDKWVRVKGKRLLSLVAVDASGDPLHSELHTGQTQEVYDEFLLYVRDRLGYRVKGVTTDLDERLERAVRRVFSPALVHQKCLWHATEVVKELTEYLPTVRRVKKLTHQINDLRESLADRKQSLYDARRNLDKLQQELIPLAQQQSQKELLLERFRAIVFAPDRATSEQRWKSVRRVYRSTYPSVVHFVARHWEGLLAHQHDAKILKTTVRAENINRQFQRRFKTIEAFQSAQTAFHYQNLYRNYLRFKPYTDCRGTRKACNGSSPLQLCQASITNPDWIKQAIRYP